MATVRGVDYRVEDKPLVKATIRNRIREEFDPKLFPINLIIILIGVIILAITIQVAIPAAFNRDMSMINEIDIPFAFSLKSSDDLAAFRQPFIIGALANRPTTAKLYLTC